jgi:hypothetical protein
MMKVDDIKPMVKSLLKSVRKKLKKEKNGRRKDYLEILNEEFSDLNRKL